LSLVSESLPVEPRSGGGGDCEDAPGGVGRGAADGPRCGGLWQGWQGGAVGVEQPPAVGRESVRAGGEGEEVKGRIYGRLDAAEAEGGGGDLGADCGSGVEGDRAAGFADRVVGDGGLGDAIEGDEDMLGVVACKAVDKECGRGAVAGADGGVDAEARG